MKTLLLKNLIFTIFVFGFVEFTFSQSYDQNVLNQNIQLRIKEINRETDSLSTFLADLKRNFEKSNSVDAKKIQDFKTTEKYDSIIHLQFTIDSSLTSNKQQVTYLEILQNRDNLLDSLLMRTVVKFQAPEASDAPYLLYITNIKDDISYNNLSSKGFKIKSDIPELIKESIYQEFLKTYNSAVLQYELQMNYFETEQLFSINSADYYSKRNTKLRKSISDEYFGSQDAAMLLISYETYTKWRKNGGFTGLSYYLEKADKKMKQGDFIAICFDNPVKGKNNAVVTLGAKGEIKYSDSYFDYDYSRIDFGQQIINEKQLSKIQIELSDNGSVKLYDQASTASFWGNYGKEINIVKRHLNAKVEIQVVQNEIQLLNEQKKKIDLQVKNLNTSLSKLESTLSQSSKSQKSKIDEMTRIIESKEKRIEIAKEEEKSRLTYIVNGDSHLKNNDFEAAISSFKNAQAIRQSSDLVEKIQISEKKYAPILAKKQEEESKRNAEIEGNRLKENEDWHSEDLLKKWLLTAPFYNYEKTVKVEFREEYVEDYNIGLMIWVYVNGNKEGELIEYKLRGSPHNTFIGIKWIRTGKIETVINVVSSSEKVMKSKRGVMTGIGAIKNGSNLRREGCSFE